MATHRIALFGPATLPDTSGNVFLEPSSVKDANDLYPGLILIFNDTATRLLIRGRRRIPANYVGSARIKGRWWTTATTGNARWEFDYRAIADGESADPTTNQESVGQTQAAPGTARLYEEFDMALTSANIAVDDMLQFALVRDGAEAGPADTIAAALSVDLESVVLEYSDA